MRRLAVIIRSAVPLSSVTTHDRYDSFAVINVAVVDADRHNGLSIRCIKLLSQQQQQQHYLIVTMVERVFLNSLRFVESRL